eukprot:4381765-Amphidinium_carterae.1
MLHRPNKGIVLAFKHAGVWTPIQGEEQRNRKRGNTLIRNLHRRPAHHPKMRDGGVDPQSVRVPISQISLTRDKNLGLALWRSREE